MTIAQFIVAYSTCWWLVLFMVLPHQAGAAPNPQPGTVPSAPANPQIKKKCLWATFIAILPTLLIYFIATNAKAQESMYHASSKGCHRSATLKPSADLNARDGYGAGDKRVAPADFTGSSDAYKGDIDIPIAIPSQNYIDPTKYNVDLSQSFIGAGKVTIGKNGNSLLNGKSISDNLDYTGDCDEDK